MKNLKTNLLHKLNKQNKLPKIMVENITPETKELITEKIDFTPPTIPVTGNIGSVDFKVIPAEQTDPASLEKAPEAPAIDKAPEAPAMDKDPVITVIKNFIIDPPESGPGAPDPDLVIDENGPYEEDEPEMTIVTDDPEDEPAIDPEVIPVPVQNQNVDWGLVIFIILLIAAVVAGFMYWAKKGSNGIK